MREGVLLNRHMVANRTDALWSRSSSVQADYFNDALVEPLNFWRPCSSRKTGAKATLSAASPSVADKVNGAMDFRMRTLTYNVSLHLPRPTKLASRRIQRATFRKGRRLVHTLYYLSSADFGLR